MPDALAVAIVPLLCAGSTCVFPSAGVESNNLKFCTVVKPFCVKLSTGLDVMPLAFVNVTAELACVESRLNWYCNAPPEYAFNVLSLPKICVALVEP